MSDKTPEKAVRLKAFAEAFRLRDASLTTQSNAGVSTAGCPAGSVPLDGGCFDPGADLPPATACLDGGDHVLWIAADPGAGIYDGTVTVTDGTWDVGSDYYGLPSVDAVLEINFPPTATSGWYSSSMGMAVAGT